jgi:ankyrin repeat protein
MEKKARTFCVIATHRRAARGSAAGAVGVEDSEKRAQMHSQPDPDDVTAGMASLVDIEGPLRENPMAQMMASMMGGMDNAINEANAFGIPPEIMDALARGRISDVEAWLGSGNSVHAHTGTMSMLHHAIMTGPIHGEATEAGRAQMVSWLLAKGAYIDVQNTMGGAWSPLMMASMSGCPSITKILLESHANAYLRSKRGDTALSIAESKNHTAIVGQLQSHELLGRSVTIGGLRARPDLNGRVGAAKSFNERKGRFAVRVGSEDLLIKGCKLTPCDLPEEIMLAATEDDRDHSLIEQWLSHSDRQPRDVDAFGSWDEDAERMSLLHTACHFSDPALVALLIQHGATANLPSPVSGIAPLVHAIIDNCEESVELLLNAQANPNSRHVQGLPILHAAIEGNHRSTAPRSRCRHQRNGRQP